MQEHLLDLLEESRRHAMRLERRLGQVEAQLGSTKHLEARLERLERRMTSFKHSVSTPFNSGRLGAKIKNSQEAMVRCTLEAWTFLTKIMRERRLASPQLPYSRLCLPT